MPVHLSLLTLNLALKSRNKERNLPLAVVRLSTCRSSSASSATSKQIISEKLQ